MKPCLTCGRGGRSASLKLITTILSTLLLGTAPLLLAQDGSLDTSFASGSGANSDIIVSVIQPDQKVLIGGYFTNFDGTLRRGIARLDTNGLLDASFNPVSVVGVSNNVGVEAIVPQPGGKVLIGGGFRLIGTTWSAIARLNADGTLDATFNPGTGPNRSVFDIAVQPDGRILVGGRSQTSITTQKKEESFDSIPMVAWTTLLMRPRTLPTLAC